MFICNFYFRVLGSDFYFENLERFVFFVFVLYVVLVRVVYCSDFVNFCLNVVVNGFFMLCEEKFCFFKLLFRFYKNVFFLKNYK